MRLKKSMLSSADLSVLVQTAAELAMTIDRKDLLNLIMARSAEMTNSPDASIILYNPQSKSLFFAGAIGENSETLMESFGELSDKQVPLEGSIAGRVFLEKRSEIVHRVPEEDGHYKGVDKETQTTTECMLCVPLIVCGECLGTMQLLNRQEGGYCERDRDLVEHFASYASVAIRNARLFDELAARMGLYGSAEINGSVIGLINQLESPAKTENLTVLFADMRGFKSLCQMLNLPEKTVEILNDLLTMLSEEVQAHGGVINKFLGDGILALFRKDEHAKRAVLCAFSIVEKFSLLRDSWNQNSSAQLDFLDIGIGITTDSVIIGALGNSKVKDFTVVGTSVNLAAAFEKTARDGKRILVDQFTYWATKDIVEETEGPFDFRFRHSDLEAGDVFKFKQYHLKALTGKIRDNIFISHSSSDREFVEKELIVLLEENKIGHWYSRENIPGAASFPQAISDGLDLCNWVIVVVSKASASSDWVKEEIIMAVARSPLRDKIIPLTIDDTKAENVSRLLLPKQAINRGKNENYINEILKIISPRSNK